MSFVTGSGLTRYGRHEGRGTLDLVSDATTLALADAGLARGDIDGLVCGYSTTLPHLMLSTVFAEHFGLKPSYAHAVQLGGAKTPRAMRFFWSKAILQAARPNPGATRNCRRSCRCAARC